jgi:phosphotransferase system HPr (HPr) family protein
MNDTHEIVLTITNDAGLHLRPAALFVRTAARFTSDIRIANLSRDPSKEVNAKSMMGLMQLGVGPGQQVQVRATGEDAADAVAALEHLVANNFAEQP